MQREGAPAGADLDHAVVRLEAELAADAVKLGDRRRSSVMSARSNTALEYIIVGSRNSAKIQAFYIPSGSMENTLVKDDRVIVSKLTPGPFDLKRGDVVVFEDPGVPSPWLGGLSETHSTVGGPFHDALVFVGLLPEDSENHLIKRVIGLPGDHVQADGDTGKIKVNGVEITEPYVKPGDFPSEGKKFDITVPAGRIWVMGDHRSDSSDSRWHDDGTGATGSVPMDKVVGRALFVVWPIDHVTWLGVPERTFSQVPTATTPSTKPAPKSTVNPSQGATPSVSATKAAAG